MGRPLFITVFGHYAKGSSALDGQTVKTRTLYDLLESMYGNSKVKVYDTHGWAKKPLTLLINCIIAAKNSNNIIIMPAHNGVKVFVPLFYLLSLFFDYRIHYVVIGGWLTDLASQSSMLAKLLKKLNYIYVETKTTKNDLEMLGFKNVEIMSNFKNLDIVSLSATFPTYNEPLRLCTFSRVIKEKGIEDAISAVTLINTKHDRVVYTLDIFGDIGEDYVGEFNSIIRSAPDFINYRGTISYTDSTAVLKDYYLLIFPTHFSTEGVPGTIIDAYAAGLPVIASRWNSFSDIIDESVTGFGYEIFNLDALEETLERCIDTSIAEMMKKNCLKKARLYKPEVAVTSLTKRLNNG
jgi:glycosyltransferase involved in cell wall biosynthesis